MCIRKLADIVDQYSNAYHRTLKMKPVEANSGTSIDFDKKDNNEDPKLEAGDHVRI